MTHRVINKHERTTTNDIDAAIEQRDLEPREFYAAAARSLLRLILESPLTTQQQLDLVDHIASQSRELHRVMEHMINRSHEHYRTTDLLNVIGNLK